MRLKRSRFVFFSLEDREHFDVTALLQGDVKVARNSCFLALSPLTGSQDEVTLDDMRVLARIPTDRWLASEEICRDLDVEKPTLISLVERGLLLSDSDEPRLKMFRHRAETFTAQKWHPLAALYHFQNRGSDDRASEAPKEILDYAYLAANEREITARFIAENGPSPSPFIERESASPQIKLPLKPAQSAFFDVLSRRKSVRNFDPVKRLDADSLSNLLYWTFGCHGWTRLGAEVNLIHRTSASGGSRHPIEVYPLILRVDGLSPGLYHYEARHHALAPLREFDQVAAQDLAVSFCEGQSWAGSCHVLFLMTARFYRNYWKYPHSARTYNVILMDAGHLGQTLYLTATELGLGAFYSAAVNGPKIEQALNIDPSEEGAIAVCGCGITNSDNDHSLPFEPFEPGKTKI